MKILFINHKKSQCGVYEFGRNLGLALKKSSYRFLYYECDSLKELNNAIQKENPNLIIYNYHPATMSWLNVSATGNIACPQAGIIHEVTQQVADRADNSLFNFHIAHDPTLLLKNPLVFKAGRLILPYENKFELPEIPVIGSFGFAGKKGQKRIIQMVQQEFDEAVVRINIPFATFGDADGKMAKSITEECYGVLTNKNIKLEITHNFLEESQLLDFLAKNTINLFLYEEMTEQRGISGATDTAMAVKRPIGITRQSMFRHIVGAVPSICVEDSSIKEIIKNGIEPLIPFYEEWSEELICWDYERIAKDIISRPAIPQIKREETYLIKNLKRTKRFIKRKFGRNSIEEFSWIGDTSINKLAESASKKMTYDPAKIPAGWSLNNILDNQARKYYAATIEQMFKYLPDLMSRKIPEANIQQAYILDSVYKIVSKITKPKILCVGSFEDSAAASLKLLGFKIEEIDPMINYDLDVFMTKPTTVKNSFDVIFSTSVIEHVEQDEKFIIQIESLLKNGGTAFLTCDYCENYRTGDPKPSVDFRLYTQNDLKERLLSKLINCELIDEPQWDCPTPDFWYEGVNYTFASFAVRKKS
jgi:Methyltransferase domain